MKFTDLIKEAILEEGMPAHYKKVKQAFADAGIQTRWDDMNYQLVAMKRRGVGYGIGISSNTGVKVSLIDMSSTYQWKQKAKSSKDTFFLNGTPEEAAEYLKKLVGA